MDSKAEQTKWFLKCIETSCNDISKAVVQHQPGSHSRSGAHPWKLVHLDKSACSSIGPWIGILLNTYVLVSILPAPGRPLRRRLPSQATHLCCKAYETAQHSLCGGFVVFLLFLACGVPTEGEHMSQTLWVLMCFVLSILFF